MRSSIIAALMAIATITLATPIKPRDTAHIDVFITEATSDSHAVQAVIGETKVLIGDNGFSPVQATALSISPNDATVDINTVFCKAFSDTDATYPIGSFGVGYELDFAVVTSVGSILCESYGTY